MFTQQSNTRLTERVNQNSAKIVIFLLLASLMLLTRGYHFASNLHLPSATLACFFLAGFFIARMKSFYGLFSLAVGIDLLSSYARGSFGDCITVSYPFLIVGYFICYQFGKWSYFNAQARGKALAGAKSFVFLAISSSLAFLTSNGSYYLLSGKFTDLNWAEYTARVAKYYLPYVQNPFIYVGFALLVYWLFSKIKVADALLKQD
ncbi:hypothetical protein HR060_01655 [Catenovulum sp. SM1970]|uniref:hypothetical protein n=1 Tax=Marinifaba aquimaris TaxID=2741323 RepID=UPI00157288DE|nr:hypothetical protein [Marinifaba aquimaris]NTS75559.1 hypothetical protein [Marinifaba aquimaris]